MKHQSYFLQKIKVKKYSALCCNFAWRFKGKYRIIRDLTPGSLALDLPEIHTLEKSIIFKNIKLS